MVESGSCLALSFTLMTPRLHRAVHACVDASPPRARLRTLVAVLVFGWMGVSDGALPENPTGCPSEAEAELAELINNYRESKGLAAIPLSKSLMRVAQWHVLDSIHAIEESGYFNQYADCNLHSWYGMPGAPYTPLCYRADHSQAEGMWRKPREITEGLYTAPGYEIAAYGYASVSGAMNGWKNSTAHKDVMLNKRIWADQTWRAMGVGVDLNHNVFYVWFATQVDPAGEPGTCEEVTVPTLSIERVAGNRIRLSWPPEATGWVLQETSNPNLTGWVDCAAELTNGSSVPIEGDSRFYRLLRR